jgi:hypothetical protein
VDCELAAGVERATGVTPCASDRAKVHDVSTVTRDHPRNHFVRYADEPDDVGLDNVLPVSHHAFVESVATSNVVACVVDQDVDFVEFPGESIEQAID